MTENQLVTNKIELRQYSENNNPRYIVNGTAIVAGKKYAREWVVDKSGKTVKVAKEMFTPHFIQSMKEQAKKKNPFADTMHELVRDASITAILKGKLTKEDEESVNNMLGKKMLPLAKINDIDIEGDSLRVYTELNPLFPTIDDYHKKVFDATWYSLEKGYLNGISLNFDNWKFELDANGDWVVDDAELLGVSFVSGASNYLHSIDEVAIRQFEKTIQTREGEKKMEDEKIKLETERIEFEKSKKAFEDDRLAFEKQKAESIKASEEISKRIELQKQIDEKKKIEDVLISKMGKWKYSPD